MAMVRRRPGTTNVHYLHLSHSRWSMVLPEPPYPYRTIEEGSRRSRIDSRYRSCMLCLHDSLCAKCIKISVDSSSTGQVLALLSKKIYKGLPGDLPGVHSAIT